MSKDLYARLSLHAFSDEIITRNKNRFVIFGNFGACNFGDEAILTGELNELKKIPESTITVVSRFPKSISEVYGIRSISLLSVMTMLKTVIRSNGVILGGGGIVCKNDGGIWSMLYQLYVYFFSAFLPILLGKNIYVIGIGFYSNAHPLIKSLYANVFKKARIVTVRDAASLSVLKKYAVPVQLYKDTSYHMGLLTKDRVLKNPYFTAMYNTHRYHVGISLKQPKSKAQEEKLLAVISDFLMNHSTNTDFWFYSLDFHPKYENDKLFGQKLYTYIRQTYNRPFSFHFVPITLSVQDTFSSFQLMHMMITMRFHGSVFAYRQKVPFVGITYDEKCTSFLESIGKNVYTVQSIDKDILESAFQEATAKLHKKRIQADLATVFTVEQEQPDEKEAILYGY